MKMQMFILIAALEIKYFIMAKEFCNRIFHLFNEVEILFVSYMQNPENVSILKSGKGTTYKIIDHKQFNSDIKNSKFIFDILETNSEVMFKFYEKNSDKIIQLLKPKTAGADISPFSPKNLPKIEYLIPKDELREYEDIIAPLKEDGKLLALSKLTQNYIKLLSKKRLYRGVDMKTYMRKKMLKGKEFIHSEGHWNDYLKYLTKEIPNV